jgi:propionyl-CoA synthetase
MSATCGIEVNRVLAYMPLLNEAIELASHKPDACIIVQRPECEARITAVKHVDWKEAAAAAAPADCVPVESSHPLYILYTSGTTGQPKGVVRDNGGHAVALKWSMKNIYGVDPGDVYWAASDVGWVVGHSYIVYAPLMHGCMSILYEGKPVGTPDAGAFWRVIADHKVKTLFTAPTAFRAIRKEDPKAELLGKYDLGSFEALFLAGERTDPDTLHWAIDVLKVPVVDHWWQTETGWPIASNCLGLHEYPIKPGSPTKPVPGWNVQVLHEETHEPVPTGDIGAICVKLPMPPSSLLTLWNADQRYIDAYLAEFPGYYKTADAGMFDADGYISIMARTDDIINVAGHRLSTGGMEEVLASHPDVAECAVIGVEDQMKGQLPFGFLVLKAGVTREAEDIVADVVQLVRQKIGPVAAFKQATVVQRLPKTRSGKILRGTMQSIADNKAWKMPATIDDPVILDEIKTALEAVGYGQARKE